MCQQLDFFVQIMMYLHLLDLSSSSLLVALGRSRLVHANKDALVARLASTLPVPTAIISSRATANIAEVHTARLASHVVAATIMLNSALAAWAHLPVDAPGQASHVRLRSCNPLGSLGLGALGHVVDGVLVGLHELLCAFHAPGGPARATALEQMCMVRDVRGESADEHGGRAVAVEAERTGSLPLALLHVKDGLVLLVVADTIVEQFWGLGEHVGIQYAVSAFQESGESGG
jgi:hypothetical protein